MEIPPATGTGDPGYEFKNETSSAVRFDRPGRLAYANAGPDTNGSQFFITEVPYPSLNGGYTIFGQCDDAAVELVKKIARMPRHGESPVHPVKITHIEIQHAPQRPRRAQTIGWRAATDVADGHVGGRGWPRLYKRLRSSSRIRKGDYDPHTRNLCRV